MRTDMHKSNGAGTVVYKPRAPKKAERAESVSIETITPEIATELLNANSNNRPLRQAHLDALARAQRDGRWRLTNDAIVITGQSFDAPGRVLNGQHRLYACVESGVPIEVMVLRGADEGVYSILDSGIKRHASDSIPKPNHKVSSQIARLVLQYERGLVTSKSVGLTAAANDEIVRTYFERPSIVTVVDRYHVGLKKIMRSPAGVLAAAAIFVTVDEAAADDFMGPLISGEGLGPGPILALRNRIVADSTHGRSRAPASMILTLKAWNAHRSGVGHVRAQLRDDDRAPPVVGYAYNPGTR